MNCSLAPLSLPMCARPFPTCGALLSPPPQNDCSLTNHSVCFLPLPRPVAIHSDEDVGKEA